MKKIFFVGIKGVGLAALALLAKQAGFKVGGSDTAEEFITDKFLYSEGITVFNDFKPNAIDHFFNTYDDACFVITTAAHGGYDNPQVQYAQKRGIKVLNYGQAVGMCMNGELLPKKQSGISICGSHGKTTISALTAGSLTLLDYDPSYIVGTSEIFPIGAAGHYGAGNFFIAEADEYVSELKHDRKSKFLYQKPEFVILNNIDFDHPDVFSSIHEVENTFLSFINSLPSRTQIIANGDDERIRSVLSRTDSSHHVITYGTGESNDYCISQFTQSGLGSRFYVSSQAVDLGEFSLSIPGYHNAKNSLSVIALLNQIGIKIPLIQEVLPKFLGTKRRFELVGTTKKGLTIIDDYAHHPAEIQATLLAAKDAFPNKKIVSVFQPHTFSRTQALLSEFIAALGYADSVILLPTFASARESDQLNISEVLIEEFQKIKSSVIPLKKEDVVEYINSHFNEENVVIVTMGAGDVYKIGSELLSQK